MTPPDPLRAALDDIEALRPAPNLQGSPVNAYLRAVESAAAIVRAALATDTAPLDTATTTDRLLSRALALLSEWTVEVGDTNERDTNTRRLMADIRERLAVPIAAPDVERLAEAWDNVMDGRRVGPVRIDRGTTTPDDWRAVAAEYARLAKERDQD